MATVLPGGTRQDDQSLPPDRHTPNVDGDNVLLGAGTNSLRRAKADWANPRVGSCEQALERDIIAALRDVDRVDDDEPNQQKTTPDVDKRPSTQDSPSRHFLDMTPANHQNQQHPMSTSTQVSGGEG